MFVYKCVYIYNYNRNCLFQCIVYFMGFHDSPHSQYVWGGGLVLFDWY